MCGITGLYLHEARPQGSALQRMTDALSHRGPDGDGYIALLPGASTDRPSVPRATEIPDPRPARAFLGHRRLTIIDLDGSRQPLANEDGTVWLVFNGEIYNYRELRQDLESRGHHLREAGDTEVLVHLWEEHGPDMVDHLVGMFAFAIYDTRQDRLFLARDRFGQKPLYVLNRSDGLAFASEIQALWTLDDFPHGEVDPIAAAAYFRYGYVPAPRTIYPGVEALPPGCTLDITMNGRQLRRYWQPRVLGTQDLDLDLLEALLDDAIRLRLRADVPLGAFLSGGIDSALLVASMTRQLDRPVRTFTISAGAWTDESAPAAQTAAHLGTDHHLFRVEPDLVGVAERLAGHYGQPFADFSSVPTYYVSRETRREVKVALAGDGGDELFAGYERYANFRWTARLARCPEPLRDLAVGSAAALAPSNPWWNRRLDFVASAGSVRDKGENASQAYHRGWRRRLFTPALRAQLNALSETERDDFRRLYDEAESSDPRERWLEVDQRLYLSSGILTKVDVASMAVSLETRAPMLDHRFAEAANRLHYSEKLNPDAGPAGTKHALRALCARRLPSETVTMPKKGFTLPLGDWLRGDLADWAETALDEGAEGANGYGAFVEPDGALAMWHAHREGRADHTLRLWMLIAWSLWRRATQSR